MNTTQRQTPVQGDIWFDKLLQKTMIHDGNQYVDIIPQEFTPEETFQDGLQRYNITENELFDLIKENHPEKLI